jgi:hypothetical protein
VRVFGSRARESNVSIGSGSETTIVIGKMSVDEIEVVNGRRVHRWLQSRPDQTLIETGTIETGEIGNAPIVRGRVVIDPSASGNPALRGRRYHATETATIETGQIGSVLIAGARTASAQSGSSSPARQARKCRAIETVTLGIEKIGSVLIVALQIVSGQIQSAGPAPQGQKDGRMIKVSSGPNGERVGGIAMRGKELP